jgi:TM2 domain-containing membrane protein YozV
MNSPRPPRSRTTAIVWALLLGNVGAHFFYLGKPGAGIACRSPSGRFEAP